jgi:hypothetical protein
LTVINPVHGQKHHGEEWKDNLHEYYMVTRHNSWMFAQQAFFDDGKLKFGLGGPFLSVESFCIPDKLKSYGYASHRDTMVKDIEFGILWSIRQECFISPFALEYECPIGIKDYTQFNAFKSRFISHLSRFELAVLFVLLNDETMFDKIVWTDEFHERTQLFRHPFFKPKLATDKKVWPVSQLELNKKHEDKVVFHLLRGRYKDEVVRVEITFNSMNNITKVDVTNIW